MFKKILFGMLMARVGMAQAATPAYDDASQSAYADGWQAGDNGGTGWGGSWNLNTAPPPDGDKAGFIVGTSQNNGFGNGNIDTENLAWGMYANSGYYAQASRSFNGNLSIGQSVILSMDNGFIDTGSSFGFTLTAFGDPGATDQFSFYFTGGGSNYKTSVGRFMSSQETDTGVGFTSAGLEVAFTLTGVSSYSVAITPNGGSTTTLDGNFVRSDVTLDHIEFLNSNAGSGTANTGFFNEIQVTNPIPEPGTAALLLVGAAGMLGWRRRRSAPPPLGRRTCPRGRGRFAGCGNLW